MWFLCLKSFVPFRPNPRDKEGEKEGAASPSNKEATEWQI